jgi:hypothetical protein
MGFLQDNNSGSSTVYDRGGSRGGIQGISWPTVNNICWQNWPVGNFFLFLDLDLNSWTVGPSVLLEKWTPCIFKI